MPFHDFFRNLSAATGKSVRCSLLSNKIRKLLFFDKFWPQNHRKTGNTVVEKVSNRTEFNSLPISADTCAWYGLSLAVIAICFSANGSVYIKNIRHCSPTKIFVVEYPFILSKNFTSCVCLEPITFLFL